MKVLIVGGVAGGASAAARLRRLDERIEIILLERDEHISYANCGLPYYLSGVIHKRDKLLVQTSEGMKKRFNIDVRPQSEVIRIFPNEKRVLIKVNGETYDETYDKLILSPGAYPISPSIPGIDEISTFTVRNVNDIDKLKGYADEHQPKHAVVIGGGFVGIEVAENLTIKGIKTTVVEIQPQVMNSLDYEMAAIVHAHLKEKGMGLILNDGVKSFASEGSEVEVFLQSGKCLRSDLIVLAMGVRPEVQLAKEAGLTIGKLGGITVNEYFQTSANDIYAIGDVIELKHLVTGQNALIPLAGPANRQGKLVADIIAGRGNKYDGSIGTSIAKAFELVVASTGANEKLLKSCQIPYEMSYTHPPSNAEYYPGAVKMSMKLIFDPKSGKILGAQIVGGKGVDKRIDQLAAAIKRGDTVFDLQKLELAYAPPFSSAKDPVNMAGYVAGNIVNGDVKIIHWQELNKLKPDTILIDVRTKKEHEKGYIPASINIPLDELRTRMVEIPKDRDIIVYCQVGLRGYLAYRMLTQHNFTNIKNLSGGWLTYKFAVPNI